MRPAGCEDFFFCSSSIFLANTRHPEENRLCEDIKTSFALHDVERSEDVFFFFSLHLISGGNLDDENCGPFESAEIIAHP